MKKEIYITKTKDLYQAAVFMAEGLKLEGVEWQGREAYWVFQHEKPNQAEELISEYLNYSLRGDCRKFAESIKALKQTLNN